jgi:hypothetical protein
MEVKASRLNLKNLGISACLFRKTPSEIQHLIDFYQEQIDLFLDGSFKQDGYGDLSSRQLGSKNVYPYSILKTKIAELKVVQLKVERLQAAIKAAQED